MGGKRLVLCLRQLLLHGNLLLRMLCGRRRPELLLLLPVLLVAAALLAPRGAHAFRGAQPGRQLAHPSPRSVVRAAACMDSEDGELDEREGLWWKPAVPTVSVCVRDVRTPRCPDDMDATQSIDRNK